MLTVISDLDPTTADQPTNGASNDSRFRRQNRLADKASFSRVFTKPKRSRDKMFTVLFSPNGTNQPRLGLAIGKKNCRLSTGRNRLKRIVRESFRRQTGLGGVDIVVINQPAASRATNRALFDSLDSHWKRCGGSGPDKERAGTA